MCLSARLWRPAPHGDTPPRAAAACSSRWWRLRPVTQPQAGPVSPPSCGRRAASRAHGQPPRCGVGETSGSAGDSRGRGGAGGDATGKGALYFLYSACFWGGPLHLRRRPTGGVHGWFGKDGYQRQSNMRRMLGPRRTAMRSCGSSSGWPAFLPPSSPASTREPSWVCIQLYPHRPLGLCRLTATTGPARDLFSPPGSLSQCTLMRLSQPECIAFMELPDAAGGIGGEAQVGGHSIAQ
jgi:hypothetical protein